jgi:hypothetical protein
MLRTVKRALDQAKTTRLRYDSDELAFLSNDAYGRTIGHGCLTSQYTTKGQCMLQSQLRRVRLALTISSILLGLLLSLQGVEQAAALVRACRGDPIVWLSNGTKVTMIASIAADASQVKMVTYTLHAPRGASVTKVLYTGGVLQGKERVIVLFDRVSGYQIEARADLGTTVALVTIKAMVESYMRSITAISTSSIVFVFP